MNAVLLLSAMMIAGSMTLTLGGYVDTMDMDADAEDAQQLIDIITKPRKPKDYHTVYETAFGNLVSYFSWNDCGSSSDVVHIQSFSLSPDPLRLPGNVTASFKWQTTVDLKSPISMDLTVQKKVLFFWATVPCRMIPGTCHHENVCADLAPITCPGEFQTCHCPFKQGTYSLNPTTISIPTGGIPSGDYRVTASFKQGSTQIGCFHMQLAVN